MINLFTNEHHELLAVLIKNTADFMLIGRYAVIHYGYGNENRDKLVLALKAFGIIDEHLRIL